MMSIPEFIKQFESEIRNNLPGELAHYSMLPAHRKLSSKALEEATNIRESAVALVLYPHEETIHCLLTQRPEYEGNHSGQVSFPGGKKDSSDVSLEETARRECYEEIGIPVTEGIMLGQLTEVYIPVSNFLVKPFVFFHYDLPDLSPDKREVVEILSFSIFDLKKEEIISEMDILLPNSNTFKKVPYFNLADKKVWGATALVLSELKEVLKRFD